MGGIGFWQILIIVLIVIVLFGAKKLPDAARSVGRSMRIFKSEVKEMGEENKSENQSPQGELPTGQSAEDFWDRPENQPNPQENLQHPDSQQNRSQPN